MSASVPTVVATSTVPFVPASAFTGSPYYNGASYLTKVIVDPYGNVFATDSSAGALFEIPFGTTTPIRINTFPLYLTLSAGGSGYTSTPTVTFSAPQVAGGVTATAVATINSSNVVSALTITNHGSGYTSVPTITISGGGGTGATASTGISFNATHGFAIDQYGDVAIATNGGANVYYLPNINGQLCTTCNATNNDILDILKNTFGVNALDSYYGTVGEVAFDSKKNLYLAFNAANGSGPCGISKDCIAVIPNVGPATNGQTVTVAANGVQILLGSLPGGKAALNMTIDASGNLYYVDGVNAYVVSTVLPAGTTYPTTATPVTIGTGFKAPSGISLDQAGNLYIVDNSLKLLTEIPNENLTGQPIPLNPADQFTVASMTNPYYSVGFDHAGNIYQADGTDKIINKISIGALPFSPTAVGGTPVTANVNYRFNGPVTPAAFAVVQGGGGSTEFSQAAASTCVAGTAYVAGGSCSVAVTFTPLSTGTRSGAVVMQTATSTALSTAYLSGIGAGAALTVDPGTQTSLKALSAFGSPSAIALDAVGNAYVADAKANNVQVISAGGTATATIGSGLSAPGGIAVDGAGNVYIADTGNSRIVEVPNEGGKLNTADQSVLPFTGLTGPKSVAVDPNGGIYVADTGNTRVVRLSLFSPSGLPYQTTIGSGYLKPVAVATDDAGNVFVADVTANSIFEINVMSAAQSVLLTALGAPTSLALDAASNLYIVDSGPGLVQQYLYTNGTYASPVDRPPFSDTLVTPTGVAVNGAGTIAISDSGVPAAFVLQRTAGVIAFGSVNNQTTSAPQQVTLTSAGTASLTLGTPVYVESGAAADYTIANGPTPNSSIPTCANAAVLAPGSNCSYSTTFAPVVTSGTLAAVLTFSSNAVNASSVTETLQGIATNLSPTTTALVQVVPASGVNPSYGQGIKVTATVASTLSGFTPTGSVIFSVDGVPIGIVNLSTASPYVASYTIPGLYLDAATHAISASYSGDASNESSHAGLIVQVSRAASNLVTTISPQIQLLPGSTFSFSVAVTPAFVGVPTGTVNLVSVIAGTTSVVATGILNSQGNFVFSYAPIIAGPYPASAQYEVVYVGDTNFTGGTSNLVTATENNPNYSVTTASPSYNVTAGQSIQIPITVTWLAGYLGNIGIGAVNQTTNAVTLPCTGLPQNATCVFSPGVVLPANGTYPVSNPTQFEYLTIATSAIPATPFPLPSLIVWPGGLGLMLLSLVKGKRKGSHHLRLRILAMAIAACGILVTMSGCGVNDVNATTPKGTSSITITFSGQPVSGAPTKTNPNIVQALTIQLTVQ